MDVPTPVRIYLETNFLIGYARGQDPRSAEILDLDPRQARLVIPGICIMEAFVKIKRERPRLGRLMGEIREELDLARRDRIWPEARGRVESLEQALQQFVAGLDKFQNRIIEGVNRIAGMAELISLDRETLIKACAEEVIPDPTDNLILATILADVANDPSAGCAFLTANLRDFGENRPVLDRMKISNLKLFGRSRDLLDWVGSLGTA